MSLWFYDDWLKWAQHITYVIDRICMKEDIVAGVRYVYSSSVNDWIKSACSLQFSSKSPFYISHPDTSWLFAVAVDRHTGCWGFCED